jgi:hypothetical protein
MRLTYADGPVDRLLRELVVGDALTISGEPMRVAAIVRRSPTRAELGAWSGLRRTDTVVDLELVVDLAILAGR